jgi:putative serine protease PepD
MHGKPGGVATDRTTSTPHSSHMPKQPPRSLWTDREDDAHERWMDPDPGPAMRHERAARPEPAKRRGRGARRTAAVLGVVALAGGGYAVGQGLGEDGTTVTAGNTTVTLPVVKGKTEETRANEIYAQVKSGVVQIKTTDGSGTGFVVDQNGTIVTNAHVVEGSKTVKVFFDDADEGVDGTVTGTDVSSDLAAVKIDPKAAKLVPLALADSDDAKPGDAVLAIGYPLGLDRTLTTGIVSGLGRQIQAQNGFSIDKVIQTDASINPGNSGGPLIDSRGRVIGVNSQIATSAAGSNTGIGFAIPSNTVRTVIPQLAAGKTVKHAYLGVSLTESQSQSGAKVAETTSGGPGARGGLQAGDLVTGIDGVDIGSPDALIAAIAQKQPGQSVELTVQRGGADAKVKVTLGERPNSVNSSSSPRETPDPSGGGSGGGSGVSPFQIP